MFASTSPDDGKRLHIALARDVQRASKAWSFYLAAGADIFIDLVTARSPEGVALEVEALLPGRHPHISDPHRAPRPRLI